MLHVGEPGRITPAYAGKSRGRDTDERAGQDHPRIRGEKAKYLGVDDTVAGSPPHTRGKVGLQHGQLPPDRITPAYAGKSLCSSQRILNAEDHPRIRGEKDARRTSAVLRSGSPPHTRGKVPTPSLTLFHAGITPAYAGKSSTALTSSSTTRDHPRIRGEKSVAVPVHISHKGSPPHTRGKALRAGQAHRVRRITPAYAGKRPGTPA